MSQHNCLSTGMEGLDNVFQGLMEGDNLVWQVNSIDDYQPFVRSFAAEALSSGKRAVYFRFGTHAPLLEAQPGLETKKLQPSLGFEPFVSEIHKVIIAGNRDCVYVFDCISELAADWNSDRMLGNFFMLTCPYVLDHGAGAYFSLIRDRHSFHAIDPVRQTTQIMVDVHCLHGKTYIHPLKVQHRYSKTMFTLHLRAGNDFMPVTRSSEAAEVFSGINWNPLDGRSWRMGYWGKTFADAEDLSREITAGRASPSDAVQLSKQLSRMLIARDGAMLGLAEKHLELQDLLAIRHHMIGTGLIGGKSVGLVLAQAILRRHDTECASLLEPTDSFFIGADVFYTYLVQNGLWWLKQRQKDSRSYLDGLTLARHQILNGQFPDYLMRQFKDLLDYFGQVPIIVRSSSLLEDDFDSAFAGKAESVLCANQGPLSQRVDDFVMAIRRVYASNMSEATLKYRASRDLLDKDEQMAILVQRVSGVTCGRRIFPHLAGVGLSFNPYVWNEHIDPEAGVLRLVMGLGSRAVTPHPEDYVRLVALNAPELQLVDRQDENALHAQQAIDALDLDSGRMIEIPFSGIAEDKSLPVTLLAERDTNLEKRALELGIKNFCPWALTFGPLFSKTEFIPRIRKMLEVLAEAYGTPVDVEFTACFDKDENFSMNLLQCRPFHSEVTGTHGSMKVDAIPNSDRIVCSKGPVIGHSRTQEIDRIIFVQPLAYGNLHNQDRHAIARLIGELMKHERMQKRRVMLIGPGRWGTSSPSLGVPCSYSELSGASVLCEIAVMHEGLNPDLSLGSHFFNELVEMRMLYFAVYPNRAGNMIDSEFLAERSLPAEVLSIPPNLAGVLKVVDSDDKCRLLVSADTKRQIAVLHRSA